LTASAFNQLGQYTSSPGRRGYCYAELSVFFPSGGRNHRQYSLCLPTEGWPGWVGDSLPTRRQSPIPVLTGLDVDIITKWSQYAHCHAMSSVRTTTAHIDITDKIPHSLTEHTHKHKQLISI